MSCTSVALCIAVGFQTSSGDGAVVAIDPTTGLALGATVPVSPGLVSVSCPSATVCEAVGATTFDTSAVGAAVAITPGTTPTAGPVQSLTAHSELLGVSCFSAQPARPSA